MSEATPAYIAQGRLTKACELEELALAAGIRADELGPPGNVTAERLRRALLDALRTQRLAARCTHSARATATRATAWCDACDKRTRALNASEDTWRLVYRLLSDREQSLARGTG